MIHQPIGNTSGQATDIVIQAKRINKKKKLLNKLLSSLTNQDIKVIEKDTDLVRFQIKEVYDDGKVIEYNEQAFKNLNGEEAFSRIVNYHFIENAWCYAINRKYYEKEKFFFKILFSNSSSR